MLGKATRKRISKKKKENKYRPLELLCADLVGPYSLSKDRKKGALIVSDARLILYGLNYFIKSLKLQIYL